MMIRVEDLAAHLERARTYGARIVGPPKDFPYGERQYTALDLDGRRWTSTESIADLVPEDWGGVSADLSQAASVAARRRRVHLSARAIPEPRDPPAQATRGHLYVRLTIRRAF